MKKMNKYFCLLLLLVGVIQIDAKEENLASADYSRMSTVELDAAFILAVKNDDSEKVEELIQLGANVNTLIPYTWTSGDCDWEIKSTALMYAVRHNCPDMVRFLLKVEKKLDETFLDEAIKEGYSAVVEELIKGGADVNYVDQYGNTPLILAIKRARANAEFSLQACEQVKSRWSQRRNIIQALLETGANVSHVNKEGRTALMEAVIEHDFNTVQKLLEIPEMTARPFFCFGTSPVNYADKDGNTALILSIQYVRYSHINNQEKQICINSQKIVNLLLEIPEIDRSHANKNGETAMNLYNELRRKINSYPKVERYNYND